MIDGLEDSTVTASEAEVAVGGGGGLQLIVLAGGRVATHPLPDAAALVIGRSPGCEIRIAEDVLSRRHAVLHTGARLTITDLGSVNGTRLRGEPLPPHVPRALAVGDLVQVSGVRMIVEPRPGLAAPRPAAPGGAAARDRVIVDPAMQAVLATAERLAPFALGLLLLGETGTGKEVLAQAIHDASGRAGALVRINCAALADSLLESELFGHERGAFTSAVTAKPGLLEAAEGGTVLLDEVGDLPLAMQAALLRVIEDRKVRRVGAVSERAIDVRFLAATHRDLREDVERGRFRRDLYYRLNGATLLIPPLRARPLDVEPLARAFAARAAERAGFAPPAFTADALLRLRAHGWPGNVRELRNAIERAVALGAGGPIVPAHLPDDVGAPPRPGATRPPYAEAAATGEGGDAPPATPPPVADAGDERARIVAALAEAHGNQTAAARLLGVSRRTLINRLDELGLPRPRKRV